MTKRTNVKVNEKCNYLAREQNSLMNYLLISSDCKPLENKNNFFYRVQPFEVMEIIPRRLLVLENNFYAYL